MRWSKLKQSVESFICEPLRGRVELRSTVYHESSDGDGRAWITIDGEEVYDFCYFKTTAQQYDLATEIRNVNSPISIPYLDSVELAKEILAKQGVHTMYEFYVALYQYLRMPIRDTFGSNNIILKSLAIIDRRIGKRRLQQLLKQDISHPLLKRLLNLRCQVEGIRQPTA